MLPPPLVANMRRQYKAAADLQTAQGAADQVGMRQEFDRRMLEDASDPWQTFRELCANPVYDEKQL